MDDIVEQALSVLMKLEETTKIYFYEDLYLIAVVYDSKSAPLAGKCPRNIFTVKTPEQKLAVFSPQARTDFLSAFNAHYIFFEAFAFNLSSVVDHYPKEYIHDFEKDFGTLDRWASSGPLNRNEINTDIFSLTLRGYEQVRKLRNKP